MTERNYETELAQVKALREAGHTWDEISTALKRSKTVLQELLRYGHTRPRSKESRAKERAQYKLEKRSFRHNASPSAWPTIDRPRRAVRKPRQICDWGARDEFLAGKIGCEEMLERLRT